MEKPVGEQFRDGDEVRGIAPGRTRSNALNFVALAEECDEIAARDLIIVQIFDGLAGNSRFEITVIACAGDRVSCVTVGETSADGAIGCRPLAPEPGENVGGSILRIVNGPFPSAIPINRLLNEAVGCVIGK